MCSVVWENHTLSLFMFGDGGRCSSAPIYSKQLKNLYFDLLEDKTGGVAKINNQTIFSFIYSKLAKI